VIGRLCLLLAVILWPATGQAAALSLSDAARRDAMRLGEQSVTSETLDGEWSVKNGAGERAVVMTPFHRLAIAARHAAFNGKPMKPGEPERVLRETRDRLVFWVTLRGRAEDFARYYVPRLVVGDREIKASFVQNERTAIREGDGLYVARCVYGFPTRDVTGGERVSLVVADQDGRDVTRFDIALASMR
jgi:hypothetical protein